MAKRQFIPSGRRKLKLGITMRTIKTAMRQAPKMTPQSMRNAGLVRKGGPRRYTAGIVKFIKGK